MIIQRVHRGAVTVGEEVVGKIGPGLVVLLGFNQEDDSSKFNSAINRLLKIRLWDSIQKIDSDDSKVKNWDSSVMDNDYEILIVSQFTLFAVLNGNKPDFHHAKKAEEAKILFDLFVEQVRKGYKPEKVQTGAFGKLMKVDIEGHGPVTIPLDF